MPALTYNVGGIDYDVYFEKPEEDGLLGEIRYDLQRIVVDNELPPQRKAQVLTHELAHAIFAEAGFDDQDEELVNRIGIVLHRFLCDNRPDQLAAIADVERYGG
ncbi:hypothetical protein JCM19037_1578 [Geomicrobium sp. JCM 19037]|uniref:ImmA/IrrE family metallo-endopeptidase n=1 Tax=Geomicrobium sp. JCM 19037 TaxID=1460634 RepID=UPI00045F3FD6|nr:ImmA/IrrE family metallo-endopeptidase [Geomicrobium sp. JCM 19037]GAK03270.1 hypothetical protein JCM19037_1578 [Geomicrobium sp. JCM 19037]